MCAQDVRAAYAAPGGMKRSESDDGSFDLIRDGVWMGMRSSREVIQTIRAKGLKSVDELVAGLSADAERTAEIGHREISGTIHSDEVKTLIGHGTLLPGHG